MKIKATWIIAIIFAGILMAGCTQQEIKPVEPSPQDKCPICGMMPAKYPDFRAQVVLKNGERYHFDSPKDMFKFVLGLTNKNEPKQWVKKEEIAGMFVTDYKTKEYIDARKAYYVVGSSVQGPMGEDLIPFASEQDASAFAKEKGGRVITYADINKELIKSLKMRMKMDMGEMGEMKM